LKPLPARFVDFTSTFDGNQNSFQRWMIALWALFRQNRTSLSRTIVTARTTRTGFCDLCRRHPFENIYDTIFLRRMPQNIPTIAGKTTTTTQKKLRKLALWITDALKAQTNQPESLPAMHPKWPYLWPETFEPAASFFPEGHRDGVSGPGLHFSTSYLRSQAALFAGVFPRKQGRVHRHAENLCPLLPKYNHSIMKEPLYSTIEIVFQLLRQLPVLFHQQIGFSTLAQHTTALLYTTSQPNDDITGSAFCARQDH
jgi:hypothetical protein